LFYQVDVEKQSMAELIALGMVKMNKIILKWVSAQPSPKSVYALMDAVHRLNGDGLTFFF